MTQYWGKQIAKLKPTWEIFIPSPPPSCMDLCWGLGCLPSLSSIYLARDFSLFDSYRKPKLTALQNPLKKPSIN